MSVWVRDTAFGHTVRLISGNKLFQYPEEQDTELWKQWVKQEKPSNLSESSREPSSESVPTNSDPEKNQDLILIEYPPGDPEHPRNWPRKKKFFVTFLICLLTTSIYIGSVIYSPGAADVTRKFHVSQVAATLGVSLFVLGYGIGPMIWAPLSEIPYFGRNGIYIVSLILFVLLQIPTALATNFGMLLAFRFLSGFIGSPVLANGGASITDMYRPAKQAYALSIWGMSAVCGPTMGPLVGGFAAQHMGWTWTIWELMWLSGFSLVILYFFLPETSADNILYRRARRVRKITGMTQLRTPPEMHTTSLKETAKNFLVRPFTLSFMEPMVLLLDLYLALVYGLLYIWFESFPLVFGGIYGFNLGEQGLAFLGIFVGALLSLPPYFWYLRKYVEPAFADGKELKPEMRLPPAFVACFLIPICLFWFGWSSRESIHWIMPIIGSGIFAIAAFILFMAAINYLSDAYPAYAASVLAGNDLFRAGFGAGFPLFATAMFKNLGIGWASSLLAFLGILFIPIPFVLFKYGETLRKNHSKYARKDF